MNRIKKTALVSVLLAGISSAPLALAAPDKAPELRQITYKYILKAQEQMADDDLAAARASLEHVLAKVKNSKYDKAAVNQMLGVVFANQEKYQDATRYFKAALADDALHKPAAQQVRYNLAQLLMMEGEFREGIRQLKTWMSNLDDKVEVPASAWIMLANGYSRMQDWKNVVDPAKQAIAASDAPPESWYTLLLAAHYELKEIPQAIDVLEILVTMAPQKKQYWLQLSGMNMSIKRDAEALAALRAAYRNGLFDKETEYTRLANFLTYQQVPYQAGVVYSDGMEQGIVAGSFDNYKKLANFWSHARENDRAIDAFNQALGLQQDPDLQLKLARMLARSERYQELLRLVSSPFEGITEKQQGELLFLTGMAHYQLGDSRQSLEYMQKAAAIKSSRGQANSWIGFLQQDLNNG
ncbi:tetratricopeptide repeat protein [Endozoicomonas sp. SCSIO W0465]|uniref:tetratricopeptide repeat protein n=1 Tax=Endozoicomonas sp. SCSIO W0465 TaxID=2918516 RepID=UPI002075F662|nr:tetratricopeptide repeat protein [Endozoicomonas sp. SCSIO W0465]USE34695.1 tetratricopeptide repeat protein [Endozoicomonas sp. SCSIO W0465]